MMEVLSYEFKEGARFQPGAHKNAKEVGAHLELLRNEFKGELTPQDVVDDARNPNSPLHSHFEWDDSRAAEQHRLKQARGLIKAVVAVYRDDSPEESIVKRVSAFVHIDEPGTPHYRSTDHAMSMEVTRDRVLRSAWKEFQRFRKRYEDLEEFASLFEVADEIQKSLPTHTDA